MIGREGMLGMPLLAGVETSFVDVQVQIPETALRMTTQDFVHEIDTNAPFRNPLLRYNEALLSQAMKTAACNANHDLEQRLARWLLMAHDRAGGNDLSLTQEFMAMKLGGHRPSFTVSAGIFQRATVSKIVAQHRIGL